MFCLYSVYRSEECCVYIVYIDNYEWLLGPEINTSGLKQHWIMQARYRVNVMFQNDKIIMCVNSYLLPRETHESLPKQSSSNDSTKWRFESVSVNKFSVVTERVNPAYPPYTIDKQKNLSLLFCFCSSFFLLVSFSCIVSRVKTNCFSSVISWVSALHVLLLGDFCARSNSIPIIFHFSSVALMPSVLMLCSMIYFPVDCRQIFLLSNCVNNYLSRRQGHHGSTHFLADFLLWTENLVEFPFSWIFSLWLPCW